MKSSHCFSESIELLWVFESGSLIGRRVSWWNEPSQGTLLTCLISVLQCLKILFSLIWYACSPVLALSPSEVVTYSPGVRERAERHQSCLASPFRWGRTDEEALDLRIWNTVHKNPREVVKGKPRFFSTVILCDNARPFEEWILVAGGGRSSVRFLGKAAEPAVPPSCNVPIQVAGENAL